MYNAKKYDGKRNTFVIHLTERSYIIVGKINVKIYNQEIYNQRYLISQVIFCDLKNDCNTSTKGRSIRSIA